MSSSESDDLRVVLVQPDLHWLDPTANLKHLSHLLCKSKHPADLVVLPEMFTSGFTQKPEGLDEHHLTLEWMQQQAKRLQSAIAGSVAYQIKSPQNDTHTFVNRLLFVTPDGQCQHYDKRHLFAMAGEHKRYQAGQQRCVVHYRNWRILLTVCYDLRFPVFCRNTNDYDVMLCVANWPQARRHPWRVLLQARAIENQSYVLGVNRVGKDGNDLSYNGDSMVVDFLGNVLVDGEAGDECLLSTVLSKEALLLSRKSFPVWKDADCFKLL